MSAVGRAQTREPGVGDYRIPPGDCEVRTAARSLLCQIERWENEGGARGERPVSGPCGRDMEATADHSAGDRSLLFRY